MAYLLHPLRVLVGKVESVAGTMETLTSADFDVRIRNPEVTATVEVDDEASKWARGNHGEDEVITGSQMGQITFSTRLTKGATVSTKPSWFKFAEGCGCLPVQYASAGWGLQPRKQNDEKTMTIWVFDVRRGGTAPTAVAYKFAGCMGNMTIAAAGVGKPWMVNFTFTGKLTDIDMNIANASILEAIVAENTCAEKFINASAYLGSNSEKVSQFSFDIGNEIQPIINQADATGFAYHAITSRKPRLSLNPLMDTHDIYGELVYGTTGCPTSYPCMVGNTGANGAISLHIPKGQVISAAVANREGLVGWDVNVKALANGVTGAVASGDLQPEVTWEILQGKRS
ncbi:MAG: hypothetical protein EHM87_16130 [Burkholderiales bacterium]|nr:MAG: hypothetical protein EHM87_16130 [Burkholderiales bacterium]